MNEIFTLKNYGFNLCQAHRYLRNWEKFEKTSLKFFSYNMLVDIYVFCSFMKCRIGGNMSSGLTVTK